MLSFPGAKAKAKRVLELVREIGIWSTALFLLRPAVRFVGAEIHNYVFTAQPVPLSAVAQRRSAGRSIVVTEIAPADYRIEWFPRPSQVIASRFEQGSVCFVAFRGQEALGCLWLAPGEYLEDEVACRYSLSPPHGAAWDFDVYVAPTQRGGRIFSYLWEAAFDWLRDRGFTWTMSRIDAFNSASIRAHRRLGAQAIGHGLFFVAGRFQLGLFNLAPFVHLCWGRNRPPTLKLHAT